MEQIYSWGDETPYNSYISYTRRTFGTRVQKIAVNAAFTCPNRDGKVAFGGCTYCNNESFSPQHLDPADSVHEQVSRGISFLKKRYKTNRFIAYFQAYSNTYAPLEHLQKLYEAALDFDEVIGLTIGTRSDCIDKPILEYLNSLAQKNYITLEYGLESMHDVTLKRINRGHDFANWQKTVNLTREYPNIHMCAHLIFGLPGENREMMLENAEVLNSSGIHYLKIHQLHIVRKTALAVEYKKKTFPLFNYDEYLQLVVDFLEILSPDIIIQRLIGEAHPRILIAPDWHIRPTQFIEDVKKEFKRRNSWQGKHFAKKSHEAS